MYSQGARAGRPRRGERRRWQKLGAPLYCPSGVPGVMGIYDVLSLSSLALASLHESSRRHGRVPRTTGASGLLLVLPPTRNHQTLKEAVITARRRRSRCRVGHMRWVLQWIRTGVPTMGALPAYAKMPMAAWRGAVAPRDAELPKALRWFCCCCFGRQAPAGCCNKAELRRPGDRLWHVRLGCSGSERKPDGDRSSLLLALYF